MAQAVIAIAGLVTMLVLLVVFLFGHDRRRRDRRWRRLFAPIERRKRARRSGSMGRYLAWRRKDILPARSRK